MATNEEGSCDDVLKIKEEKKVVVIIGPSGSGKTTLGHGVEHRDPSTCMFFSTGNELRKLGLIPFWRGVTSLEAVKEKCFELVTTTLEIFKQSSKTLLVLDFIKNLEDAQFLVNKLKDFVLNLHVAIYLHCGKDTLQRNVKHRNRIETILNPNDNVISWRKLAKFQRQSFHVLQYLAQNRTEVLYVNVDQTFGSYVTSPYVKGLVSSLYDAYNCQVSQDLFQLLSCPDCFDKLKNYNRLQEHQNRKEWIIGKKLECDGNHEPYEETESQSKNKINLKSAFRKGSRYPSACPRRPNKVNIIVINYWKGRLPANWNFLQLEKEYTMDAISRLHLMLKIKRFNFMIPATFISSAINVSWVANPNQYYVTHKTDGVRYLFMKTRFNELLLLNRAKELFTCQLAGPPINLPDDTVLDGELVQIKEDQLSINIFVAFDILSLGCERQWHLRLEERQIALESLGIIEDSEIFLKSASMFKTIVKGGENAIILHLARKKHLQSTPQEIKLYLDIQNDLKIKSLNSQNHIYMDGLVFTPNMAYTFGTDEYVFKWQPSDKITCDQFATNVYAPESFRELVRSQYRHTDIVECTMRGGEWCAKQVDHEGRDKSDNHNLEKFCFRSDKIFPNSSVTIQQIDQLLLHPFTARHFLKALDDYVSLLHFTVLKHLKKQKHPLLLLPFDKLYKYISEEVRHGNVEKSVDKLSGLEIYNYYQHAPMNGIVCLCRGLVLHPSSKSVVTKPFVRFGELGDTFTEPSQIVEASIKWDGSLGLAFIWNEEILVCTRRRMDSEQALWAKRWIQNECDKSVFRQGWTYMFEIIYSENTVIIDYPFEGLVLLSVTNTNGEEIPYHDMYHIASHAGFTMVSHKLIGRYSEMKTYCGNRKNVSAVDRTNQEGWVIQTTDGRRIKSISEKYKARSRQARLIHPQVIWLLLRQNQLREFTSSLEIHHQEEVEAIVTCIQRQILFVVWMIISHMKKEIEVRKVLLASLEDIFDNMKITNGGGKDYGNKHFGDKDFDDKDFGDKEFGDKKFNDRGHNSCVEPICINSSVSWQGLFSQNVQAVPVDINIKSEVFYNMLSEDKEFEKLFNIIKVHLRDDDVKITDIYDKLKKNEFVPFLNVTPIFTTNLRMDNILRVPLLDFIRPRDHKMIGYKPSENFKQTWCKGWKQIENVQENVQSVLQTVFGGKQPCFLLALPTEVVERIFMLLVGDDLKEVRMCSKRLCSIVDSNNDLKTKIIAENQADYSHEEFIELYLDSLGFHGKSWGSYEESWNSYEGYGST